MGRPLLAVALLGWLACPGLAFDKVLLKDGRLIKGTIVETDDPDITVLDISGFEIPIGNDLIESTYVENLENYVPKSKKEEAYLKKGWVLFEGRWMSASRREKALRKRADEDNRAIEQARKRQEWRHAVTVSSPVFSIRSNLDPDVLDSWVAYLKTYYKYFKDFWGITRKTGFSKTKMKVFLYRSPEDFHKVTNTPGNIGGFFNWALGELHIPYDHVDPDRAVATLFHEFNHLLTHLIGPDFSYPIWLNEGMAEYYGTAQVDEKGRFRVGRQQDGRIVNLMRDKDRGDFLRLKDVLLTKRDKFGAREYAYSWSFVHFLMESDKYAKRFAGFFGNLPNNRDIPYFRGYVASDKPTLKMVELPDVLSALEKRLSSSIEELEEEWLAFMDQAYGELSPMAYYRAARIEYRYPKDDDSHVLNAIEYYEKAIELGIQFSQCYRSYAELLRKGGIVEYSSVATPLQPDPERAWELIRTAIGLDPVDPLLYCEAAGILIMDGPVQDLEQAVDMAETAKALGPRSPEVRSLVSELMGKIEPAREQLRKAAEARAAAAALDARVWIVFPFYFEGEPEPERITDLSTSDLRDLIRSGAVGPKDHLYQSHEYYDESSDSWITGGNPWDQGWVAASEVPEFSEDLAAAKAQ